MKVLVTGHRGYLGAVVVPMLLEAGHDVSGYDLDYFGHCTYSHGGPYRAVPTMQKDIRDAVPEDFIGFEAVVHLAALPDTTAQAIGQDLVEDVNHRACVRVALAARQAGASRFLLASSAAAYGESGEDPVDETGALKPLTADAVAKVMAERDVAALANADFSPTFLRLPMLCGLSPRLRLDLLFNWLIATAFTEDRLPLPLHSEVWRPFVHVQDVARVASALLREPRPAVHNQIFNVGTVAGSVRVRDAAAIIAELSPPAQIEEGAAALPHQESCRLNCDKLTRLLPAAAPQWTLDQCISQMLDAFEASALDWDDVVGSRYDRARELTALVAEGTLDAALHRRNGVQLPHRNDTTDGTH